MLALNVIVGWTLFMGKGIAGSHSRCLLLRLPGIADSGRNAGRILRCQVGTNGMSWTVDGCDAANASGSTFQLCSAHCDEGAMRHWIGKCCQCNARITDRSLFSQYCIILG